MPDDQFINEKNLGCLLINTLFVLEASSDLPQSATFDGVTLPTLKKKKQASMK